MMKTVFRAAASAALASVLCAPAFAQRTPADEPGTRLANPPVAGLSESEVVGIIDAANQQEITAGQMAIDRAQNAEVKEFARKMVSEHEDNRSKLEATGLRRSRGEATNKMNSKHKALNARLGRLEGAAFDRAYMNAMVEDHQMLLDKLDRKMIPAAKTWTLSSHLTETRSAVEMHLEEARRIKASLGTK
jgi:putative membrane protein